MTISQTAPVTDEELDQMIWKLERDGMTPKQLSLMRELRDVRSGYLMQFTKEQRDILIKTAEYMANRENTSDYSENIRKVAEIALAVLQSSGNSEQLEPVSNRDELPATQFKPVADLYGITSPTGSETSFTFDAIEAANFIEGGWSVQEYVELERYQEAMISNSPATPDGWVMVPVEPTPEMRDAYHNAQEEYESVDGLWSPDHQWKAMIAAAPKEVG